MVPGADLCQLWKCHCVESVTILYTNEIDVIYLALRERLPQAGSTMVTLNESESAAVAAYLQPMIESFIPNPQGTGRALVEKMPLGEFTQFDAHLIGAYVKLAERPSIPARNLARR